VTSSQSTGRAFSYFREACVRERRPRQWATTHWTDALADQAMAEGWGIDGDSLQIVRDDDAKVFSSDTSAYAHVLRRAATGDAVYRVALTIHGFGKA
jgi:hypothetical protein